MSEETKKTRTTTKQKAAAVLAMRLADLAAPLTFREEDRLSDDINEAMRTEVDFKLNTLVAVQEQINTLLVEIIRPLDEVNHSDVGDRSWPRNFPPFTEYKNPRD